MFAFLHLAVNFMYFLVLLKASNVPQLDEQLSHHAPIFEYSRIHFAFYSSIRMRSLRWHKFRPLLFSNESTEQILHFTHAASIQLLARRKQAEINSLESQAPKLHGSTGMIPKLSLRAYKPTFKAVWELARYNTVQSTQRTSCYSGI